MLLCLDVGNSHIFGGLFNEDASVKMSFRITSKAHTSDEFAIFLLQVLRENQINPSLISKICICSVVPHLDYSLRAACIKYFSIHPFFISSEMKTGLVLQYAKARELGADRLANAIAAIELFPNENVIILDFGTAITLCAIDAHKNYLGGSIFPGLRLLVESLAKNTAKLPIVDVVNVKNPVAKTTVAGIQSGIFYGTLGACREMIEQYRAHCFKDEGVKVIATGGFSGLFEKSKLYDVLVPNLILQGMYLAVKNNPDLA